MVLAQTDRLRAPISTSELHRRWRAIRAAMAAHGVDVLLVYNNADVFGGYVRYFSDVSTDAGWHMTIVFPADDDMTVLVHGNQGLDVSLPPQGDGLWRGVKTTSTTWSFSSVAFSEYYDADRIAPSLRPFAGGVIGLLGHTQMPYPMVSRLKELLPKARFVNAADFVDPIKAVKSPEEREGIHEVARQQEATFEAALAAIAPGVPEYEVYNAAISASNAAGGEGGLFGLSSAATGEPVTFNPRQHQNRRLRRGDHVILLIETCGPGGLHTEVGRTVFVGRAPDAAHTEHAFALEAQRYCTSLLKPGAHPATVFESYNAFMREHNRPEERRVHCHGQGYDQVERPLVRSDETMALAEHMNLACHPMFFTAGVNHWLCDGFLIERHGASEPLHRIPQTLFETG